MSVEFQLGSVGRSEAGRRIHLAGLAFERRQKLAAGFHEREAAVAAALAAPEPEPPMPTREEVWFSPGRSVRNIIADVAFEHGLTVRDILGSGRQRKLVVARHAAMYRAACETLCSLPQLGRFFGDRDHTTVLHGIQAHCRRTGDALPRGMVVSKRAATLWPKEATHE